MKRVVIILFLILFSAAPNLSSDQSKRETKDEEIKPRIPTGIEEALTLEKAVDPDEYIVGPGDKMVINFWEEYSTQEIIVMPEGSVLIPQVGSVKVSGFTLSQAKRIIKDELLKRYKKPDFTIVLTSLRKFKVSVTGSVEQPGTYSAFAHERISEIIQKAGGFTDSSSQRNIIVKRTDQGELKVDIGMFLIIGDKSKNPYALDGDVIFVPILEDTLYHYGIYGAVRAPGEYEYGAGDSLMDLVNLAHGLTSDANLSSAEITRFNPDNQTTSNISVSLKELLAEGKKELNLPLMPDDRVFIRSIPKYHEKKQVTILGEVLYPGVYAIEEGKTRLTDIVRIAGGFTSQASLPEAEMIRGYYMDVIDLEYERLKKMDVADMSEQEYEYFKTKSREKRGKISCDFIKLFQENDKNQDILLKNGDLIRIPAKSLVVRVSGNVVNPGLVSFEPDKNYLFYIEKAGGLSWRASKRGVRVIKEVTSEWVKPKKSTRIDPGDTIWIPEKPRRDYWGFFKDTMLVLGNIATLYLVVKTAVD
ncbi:MAG: SLBB domain-containing protein [Candidatus Zixiibacteriota bacterium]